MNILIRAEASLEIGSGHIMRCLTLADACRARGAVVTFACRSRAGDLNHLIRQREFDVIDLGLADGLGKNAEPNWLGAETERDVAAMLLALHTELPRQDWLVADNYGIGQEWESRLRPQVGGIMVIDDLANRPHDCDLLLDQNLITGMQTRYTGKAPGATLLLGPQYALLRDDYEQARGLVSPRESIDTVLVYFGGADLQDLTGRTVRAVFAGSAWKPRVDVVLSPASPNFQSVRDYCERHDTVTLHTQLPSLAGLMSAADLAVGAVGATSWERLCLGLPTIGITIADNQVPVAKRLAQDGLMLWLGDASAVSEAALANALDDFRARTDLAALSRRAMDVCDGAGTKRVVASIWSHSQLR